MTSLLEHPWWLLALAGVGTATLVGVFITLFTSLGRRPRRLVPTSAPPVDSREFLQAIAHTINAPLERGGTASLLNNGDSIFSALFDDLRAAQHTINFSAYIWEPGELGDRVSAVLAQCARNGVQVRVLLDGLGGIRAPGEHIDRMREAGVKVNSFRTVAFGKLLRFHKRNHRRAIIIDGRIGYTGGAAIGDKWLGDARNKDEWRDNMVRVTGPAATSLQSAFTELWAYVCGEMLVGPEFYPMHPDDDGGMAHVSVVSSPASEEHPLRLFYMLSFASAREKLYISTPYFVPDKHTRDAVAARARAGVDVRILLPNELTDARPIRYASHSYFEELLAAGVRIYEFQASMMHAKTCVIDSKWCVVGSANMDIRSKELNQENVLGILDSTLAQQLESSFMEDLKRSEEIHLATWIQRNPLEHVKERFFVLFAEQY